MENIRHIKNTFRKLCAVAIMLVFFAACPQTTNTNRNSTDSQNLALAQESILTGQYADARSFLSKALMRSSKYEKGELLYWRAYTFLLEGQFNKALYAFIEADKSHLSSDLKTLSQKCQATCYDNLKQYDEAIRIYKKLIRWKYAPLVEWEFKLGLSYQKLGKLKQAQEHFRHAAARSTSLPFAKLAEEELSHGLNGEFFLQCGLFSKYLNASNIVDLLRKKHRISSYIKKIKKGNIHLFSVRIGHYKSKRLAIIELKKLQSLNLEFNVIVKP